MDWTIDQRRPPDHLAVWQDGGCTLQFPKKKRGCTLQFASSNLHGLRTAGQLQSEFLQVCSMSTSSCIFAFQEQETPSFAKSGIAWGTDRVHIHAVAWQVYPQRQAVFGKAPDKHTNLFLAAGDFSILKRQPLSDLLQYTVNIVL